jgi:two-component system response regulator HupR/HoxA
LLESELFGAKRGAYTGAYEDRIGLLAQADGGTIFLDEIGETSPAFQVKLLRALQEGEIRPVGASRSITVNVRVIAATNRDLESDVRAGRFREDLYYRLSGMTLRVPALRERRMDIPLIAEYLLEEATSALGKRVSSFAPDAMAALVEYAWPGNVRELANEIYRMVALCDGQALAADTLSPRIRSTGTPSRASATGVGTLRERVDSLEAQVLAEALARNRGNKTRVAAELGLSRVGLRAKLARHGLATEGGARRAGRRSGLFAVK